MGKIWKKSITVNKQTNRVKYLLAYVRKPIAMHLYESKSYQKIGKTESNTRLRYFSTFMTHF